MNTLLFSGLMTFAALQGADVATTQRALKAGYTEANPLMPKNVWAEVGVKSGVTAVVVATSTKHRKVGVVLTWGLNSVYAAIVYRNYQVVNHVH